MRFVVYFLFPDFNLDCFFIRAGLVAQTVLQVLPPVVNKRKLVSNLNRNIRYHFIRRFYDPLRFGVIWCR